MVPSVFIRRVAVVRRTPDVIVFIILFERCSIEQVLQPRDQLDLIKVMVFERVFSTLTSLPPLSLLRGADGAVHNDPNGDLLPY